jgi:hypothetical protein
MAQQRRRQTGSASAKRSASASSAKKPATGKTAARKAASKAKARKAPTRGTAPSSANIRDLDLIEPSDDAKAATPSDVDAMGDDKRRAVIGHAYGPSRASQLAVLGAFLAVVAILFFGVGAIARKSDERPKSNPDAAPWSAANAPQTPAIRPE